jgi:pimeloyl-ACP methyl ester carboxylesterase
MPSPPVAGLDSTGVTPETRYARNGDVHLAYQVWGEGDVDLVLVFGFVSNIEIIWQHPALRRFYERLGSFARVIGFDRRGTGLSDPFTVERAPDMQTRMDDLRTVMDAADSTRAVLLGQSEGGPTSILFAATFPERVRALILGGSMARTTYSDDHPWLRSVEDFVDAGNELILPAWGRGVGVDFSAPSVADDPEAVALWGRLERTSITPGMLASVAAMFYDTDVRAVLPALQIPTLILHCRGDRLVNVRSGRYLAEHIPGARFTELPGSDHAPWFQHPDMWLEEIEEFVTGHRTVTPPDRRLATVLFSDIVGSTERAAAVGDAHWSELMDRHHHAVREQIERFGGREIKTLGDGFLVTFDGPTSAIRAALAIRDATSAIGIPVRLGMHSGEIEVSDLDIAGMTVVIAARISALADVNEVLLSRTVKDLLVGSGMEFSPRGSHTLKGVPDSWELYTVT